MAGCAKLLRPILNRMIVLKPQVADLKRLCSCPEVVEVWDTTAADPRLLVFLKAYRNTVPVPRHWSQKRKYLQGKRGLEKAVFQLPDFIAATGIEKIRQAYQEKETEKKLKQKQKDKLAPKMGKMDIDYQVLHDAFFRFQTKPILSAAGDLYYEGKEYEIKMKEKKPGQISEELREALGMPKDAPPPWLINMQRYGPPPSYPNLKIPGLNAPIPAGASFGYHPGGWGKPPVDEYGKPLYGDVFGLQAAYENPFEENIDRHSRWGDLEEEEEEEESEDEVDDEAEDGEDGEELTEEQIADGTASGFTSMASLPSGVETPDVIDLRKKSGTGGDETPQLYQVLQEQEASVGGAVMGSAHTYALPGADDKKKKKDGVSTAAAAAAKKAEAYMVGKGADMEVTLRPEELEGLDEAAIAAKYEQRMLEERDMSIPEDFSGMVAEKAKQAKRKRYG